jgi:hypothetical protein
MNTDRHIVIEASHSPFTGLEYLIVTPPLDWHTAQEQWVRFDRTRVRLAGGHTDRYYMVRAADDPRWADLPKPKAFTPTRANLAGRGTEPLLRAAKAYAETQGITGRAGGWLYGVNCRPLSQGWHGYAKRMLANGRLHEVSDRPYPGARTATAWFVWASPRAEAEWVPVG